MAEETEIPSFDLPYDTEFLNSACYALEVLNGVDGKLYSAKEDDRIERSKRRLRQIIHATVKAIHQDYFQKEDEDDQD